MPRLGALRIDDYGYAFTRPLLSPRTFSGRRTFKSSLPWATPAYLVSAASFSHGLRRRRRARKMPPPIRQHLCWRGSHWLLVERFRRLIFVATRTSADYYERQHSSSILHWRYAAAMPQCRQRQPQRYRFQDASCRTGTEQ